MGGFVFYLIATMLRTYRKEVREGAGRLVIDRMLFLSIIFDSSLRRDCIHSSNIYPFKETHQEFRSIHTCSLFLNDPEKYNVISDNCPLKFCHNYTETR